jgi:hypothetical protein
MPKGSRSTEDGRLIKLCAIEHDVSPRTASNWRANNDPRWTDWKKARKGGRPTETKEESPLVTDGLEIKNDGLGRGIEPEIFRCQTECEMLSHLAQSLIAARSLDEAGSVFRVLTPLRESLRKLSADNPDILEKSGDLVHKSVMFAHNQRLKTMLESLARRIMAVVPDDMRDTLRAAIEKEVAAICAAAQEIDLNK